MAPPALSFPPRRSFVLSMPIVKEKSGKTETKPAELNFESRSAGAQCSECPSFPLPDTSRTLAIKEKGVPGGCFRPQDAAYFRLKSSHIGRL